VCNREKERLKWKAMAIRFMPVVLMVLVAGLLGRCRAEALQVGRTYVNPVGGKVNMGDPFVLRYGDRYYLYGTTAGDGFKCWRSSNLVDWQPAGYAYKAGHRSWGGKTFWAPEVVYYKGKFYMVFSCQPAKDKEFTARICLAVSDRPEGPFKDFRAPLFDDAGSYIDGHIFIDEDGSAYLFFDKVGTVGDAWSEGANGYLYGIIYGVRLKDDLTGITGEPVKCLEVDQRWELGWSAGQPRTRCDEGACVFKHDGKYYMTYSANYYADPNYGIGYATAAAPLGPWTKSKDNPMVRKDTSIGVSGPGHNSVTISPDGKELFMVYHTHADPNRPSGERVVNIDRLVFDKDGKLKLIGPTRSGQPMPSGAK